MIKKYLSLISDKLFRFGLFKGHCNTSNCVRVRPALKAWEDCSINFLLVIVFDLIAFFISMRSDFVENQRSSWTSHSLMSGSHYNISIFKGTFDNTSSHKARGMCNIGMQNCSNLITNFSEFFVIQKSTVSRSTCHNKPWSINSCHSKQLIIVDKSCAFIQVIRKDFKIFRNRRDFFTHGLESVTQVTTVWKVERHDSVVWV